MTTTSPRKGSSLFSETERSPREASAPDGKSLVALLRHPSPGTRSEAARALRGSGSEAVAPLCALLKDSSLTVRAAAAESLAEIGDERAIGPLKGALHRCFVAQSPWRQIAVGLFVPPLALLVALVLLGLSLLCGVASIDAFLAIGSAVKEYYSQRRLQSRLAGSITVALQRIAERHPGPELRALLPDLKAVCADVVQQEQGTRRACREAAARIEALTARVKHLPTPAACSPEPDSAALPRPAG